MMGPAKRQLLGLLLAVLAGVGFVAPLAQAAGPPPTPIQLERYERFPSARLAIYTGTVTADPHVLTLDDLSILSPVALTLRGEPGSGLKLKISKYAEEPLREASLDAEGRAEVRFRTQGGFIAHVSGSGEPTPYALLVAVGDEAKPELPSILTSYEDFAGAADGERSSTGGGPGSSVLWVIAIALVAIVILLGILVLRRARP